MEVLLQFLYRLAFGLATAMALTSPRQVTSGYFRVHSYVLLGLGALAALVAPTLEPYALWPAIVVAVAAYLSAVAWHYEKAGPGILLLLAVAVGAVLGAWQAELVPAGSGAASALRWFVWKADPVSGGLILGTPMAAMLLGHWYLNSPGMQLAPLRRLVALIVLATFVRTIVAATGLGLEIQHSGTPETSTLLFLVLRWLAGLVAPLVLALMTWKTLDIPNTQSATGILYVIVIVTFVGELTAQLLSTSSMYPL
ncbi:MAG: hypothetical protein MI757_18655 [Pirellulales bacterium]|nr:hypothetical protein [Pirellulales bacterium]